MIRPTIGITTSYSEEGMICMRPNYVDALWRAGAIGVLLAHTDEPERLDAYAAEFDGFLFSGGGDVDPKYYGEREEYDHISVNPERDRFEFALMHRVLKTRKPVLGICRGAQLLNVAMGGSLYQHVPKHGQRMARHVPSHCVTLTPDTPLARLIENDQIMVNSFHHQAVKVPARGMSVAAMANDGTIEAICRPGKRFVMGVQWHPELLPPEDEASQRIFRGFVEATERSRDALLAQAAEQAAAEQAQPTAEV